MSCIAKEKKRLKMGNDISTSVVAYSVVPSVSHVNSDVDGGVHVRFEVES